MIELIVGAGLVTLGVVAVRAIQKQRRRDDDDRSADGRAADAEGTTDESSGDAIPEPAPATRPRNPRGLRVDDVLLYADDELWLAGEIHLDEEGFAISLFRTPGSPRSAWVAQLDPEAREVGLLSETDDVPGGVIPTELPIGGLRLTLRRRGQADVRTDGEQLPLVTERARYAILSGPGGRMAVVVDFEGGDRLALAGERLGREMLDLLPGGETR